MPSDLTADDKAALAALLRATIVADRFPLSPRVRELKAILAKLEPPKVSAVVYPAPKPSAVPSMALKKDGVDYFIIPSQPLAFVIDFGLGRFGPVRSTP